MPFGATFKGASGGAILKAARKGKKDGGAGKIFDDLAGRLTGGSGAKSSSAVLRAARTLKSTKAAAPAIARVSGGRVSATQTRAAASKAKRAPGRPAK